MSVIKFDRDFNTLFNWDTDDNPTTEQDYQNAVKNWTETEMYIVDTLLWQPTTEYATGNIVKTPSLPSQYVLRCAEAGTSGSTEPSYSGASVGDTVTDGSVEWVIVSLATGNAADADASNIGVNAEVDNSEAWASAIGGGAIAEDDGRLVKGDTVYAVTSVMESNIATNTEAIGDNAEAIATNTANIESSAVKIDIDDKRISNIEKLLQGNLYDYQTDSNSAYTKTVLAGAMPYASLDALGGKTVVWNQICVNGNFEDDYLWNHPSSTITANDNVLTATLTAKSGATQISRMDAWCPTVIGHKYYASCEVNPVKATTCRFQYNSVATGIANVDIPANTWTRVANLYTCTNNVGTLLYYNVNTALDIGDTVQFRNYMLFDLTLMFGAGNEPSTVAEFQQMFPAVWYAHNPRTLLSAGVTEVKSVGKNLLNFKRNYTNSANGLTAEIDKDTQTITVTGTNTKTDEGWLLVNINVVDGLVGNIEFKPNTTYCFSVHGFVTGMYGQLTYYDVNNVTRALKYITTTSSTFTTPADFDRFRAFQVGINATTTTTNTILYCQVEESTTATAYAPYKAPITYPIPASIQALEGYGWSAGSVYNYVDFERKVFVQRVDRVDLGSLTYYYNSVQSYFIASDLSPVAGTSWGTASVGNVVCSQYITEKWNNIRADVTDKACSAHSNQVRVSDSAYTYANTFKTAMDGVYLYYELATPVEVDIRAYLTDDNLIEVEPNGTLTFENQNGDDYRIPVQSAETYMVDLQSALGE